MRPSSKWLLTAILLLALYVRSLSLNQSLWLDEAAQAIESARPLPQQFDIKSDFWPPLFHLLLHFWISVGRSEIWMRLISVIFGVTTVYFTYKLTRTLFSTKAALLTTLFMAFAPFHIWYSQEVRPYTLATFLGVVSTYLLLKHKFWGYAVSSALFLYCTYLAPFLLLTHAVFISLFDRESWRRWLIGVIIAVVAFLPWLPRLNEQLTIGQGLQAALPGWSEVVSTPPVKSLPLVFTKFILGRVTIDNKWLYGGLVFGLFLLFGLLVFRNFRANKIATGKIIIFGGLPILLAFFASLILPILAPQRVLFSLPFFYVLWAQGILSLGKQKLLKLTTALVLVFLSSYAVILYSTNPRFQREKWREAVTFIEDSRTVSSAAVFVFPDAFAPWQWYSREVVTTIPVAPTFTVKEIELANYRLRLMKSDRIYYFHYLTELTDPQRLTQKFIGELGFIEIGIRDFPGVGFITIYEKALARS